MTSRLSCLVSRLSVPALLLALMGCSTKIAVCPVPAILADTASVTFFRPGTKPDLANELYTVTLINAQTDCVYTPRTGLTRSSLDLTFRATRTPTDEAPTYTVPYYVVVHEGAKLYAKRIYNLRFSFAPGAATAVVTQSPDDTRIKIETGKLPWNYQLLAGFQMTAAQIEYNKTRARYVP